MNELEKKLVERLHSAAMYNDKGYFWMRNSSEVMQELRTQWRGEIGYLVQQIGAIRFSPELLGELLGPEIVEDASGDYARKVELWLSRPR